MTNAGMTNENRRVKGIASTVTNPLATDEISKELMTTAPKEGAVVGLIHDQDRGWCGRVSVM